MKGASAPFSFTMKIKEITLKNIKYVIQAKYRMFIKREYNKYYSQDKVDDMLYKVASCPECYSNGIMECCGCVFKEALLTNKSCKNGKF